MNQLNHCQKKCEFLKYLILKLRLKFYKIFISMKYNFILGVGAQKSGTTWLYNYLKGSKNSNLGELKEWHIWDAKYINLCSNFKLPNEKTNLNKAQQIRLQMQTENKYYEKYFLSLMSKEINITGDITPSYCGLNFVHFLNIKNKLKKIGFNIKVVFLMRDPVLRCWSATRMIIKLNKKYQNISNLEANNLLLNYYNSPGFIMRTKYENTIINLKKAFSKDEIFIGFYENLFNNSNLDMLSNFLGIKESLSDKHHFTNVSPSYQLHPEISKICRNFYKDTYDYCFTNFPITEKLWKNNE